MHDAHCHIIWGVDDGSDSWETTCQMVEKARACGFTRITCTPHMRWDDFDKAKVEQRFEQMLRHEELVAVSLAQPDGRVVEHVYFRGVMYIHILFCGVVC